MIQWNIPSRWASTRLRPIILTFRSMSFAVPLQLATCFHNLAEHTLPRLAHTNNTHVKKQQNSTRTTTRKNSTVMRAVVAEPTSCRRLSLAHKASNCSNTVGHFLNHSRTSTSLSYASVLAKDRRNKVSCGKRVKPRRTAHARHRSPTSRATHLHHRLPPLQTLRLHPHRRPFQRQQHPQTAPQLRQPQPLCSPT